jgi:hypothetical protein
MNSQLIPVKTDLSCSQRWWWRNQSYGIWHRVCWYTGADVSLEDTEYEDSKLLRNNSAYVELYMTKYTKGVILKTSLFLVASLSECRRMEYKRGTKVIRLAVWVRLLVFIHNLLELMRHIVYTFGAAWHKWYCLKQLSTVAYYQENAQQTLPWFENCRNLQSSRLHSPQPPQLISCQFLCPEDGEVFLRFTEWNSTIRQHKAR